MTPDLSSLREALDQIKRPVRFNPHNGTMWSAGIPLDCVRVRDDESRRYLCDYYNALPESDKV